MEIELNKKPIHCDNTPAAIGTYSQAIQSGSFVFMSGQIPLVPATMEIVEGDFETRTKQVFENLKAMAEEAGGSLDQIVKLTLYLTDMNDFATVNKIMATYFNEPYPARAAVGVASLPKNVDIEAEAIMAL